MSDLSPALKPILDRVRTDVSAVKKNGRVFWTKEALSDSALFEHLNGGVARGVCPIKQGENTTKVALLDLDSHKGESTWVEMIDATKAIVGELNNAGINPIVWRSSGGKGIHIFMLWSQQQDAYSVRCLLEVTLEKLGYKNGTKGVANKEVEIFPKQNSVPEGGFGNQFILPLAGESVPLDPHNYKPLNREDALSLLWPVSASVPECKERKPSSGNQPDFVSLQSLEDLLQYISPFEGYDVWVRVGMSLYNETNGSNAGLRLWAEWSDQQGADYPGYQELEYKWESFKSDVERPATIGTLIFLAKQSGWSEGIPILTPADHSGVARRIVDDRFRSEQGDINLVRTQGLWFKYNGRHYEEVSDESIRAVVRQFLDEAKKINQKNEVVPFHPTMQQIGAIVDALKAITLCEDLDIPSWLNDFSRSAVANEYISMENGIFLTSSRKLVDHTSNFFSLNSLSFPYEVKGEPTEFLKFLCSIWGNDQESIDTLQECMGYLLVPDVSHHKMFLIKGPKRSGKGTIGRILKELLGASNVCNPTLNSLTGAFGLQPLIGKLAAVVPDARIGGQSNKQAIVESLLMVSGGDNVSVPRKHIENWDGQLKTRIIILTNDTPQLGDASGALASRFIVLEMKNSFYGREDLDLESRLLQELPQIFNWALEGLDRLKSRKRFIQPKSAIKTVYELEALNSPIMDFVNCECELGLDNQITKDRLYSAYRSWCIAEGISYPRTLAVFSRDLQGAFPQVDTARLGSGKNREHVFYRHKDTR